MSQLRHALDALADRGSPRGAKNVFAAATEAFGSRRFATRQRPGGDDMVAATVPRRGRRVWVAFVASFAGVLAMGLLWALLAPAGGGPERDAAERTGASAVPGPTLIPVDGVPMTVAPGAALSFYAYLPDVHLAWRATDEGGTQLCWRTPAGDGCGSDLFYAPDTVVLPNGDHVVVLTRPALGGGSFPSEVTVELSNGETVTAPLNVREGIALTYARVSLSPTTSVVSARAR